MSLLLVIRHAIAEDRAEFAGADDAERPLTAEGRRKMRQAARALRSLVPELDLVATSPLRRARETADIVAEAYGGLLPRVTEALQPGSDGAALLTFLAAERGLEAAAVVGHEPTLGRQASFLLTGRQGSFLELKKGAAALLELESGWRAGAARLCWLLQPAQLRRLAE